MDQGTGHQASKGFCLTAHFRSKVIFPFLIALCNKLLLVSSSLISSFVFSVILQLFKLRFGHYILGIVQGIMYAKTRKPVAASEAL